MEINLSPRAACYLKRLAEAAGKSEAETLEAIVIKAGAYHGPYATLEEAQHAQATGEPRKWPGEK